MKKIKSNLIDGHISFVYEDICKEKMWDLNAENKWNFYFNKVGRWWDNNNEIDIVALDTNDNNIIFGECKYWNTKVYIEVLQSLENKAKYVNWNNDNRNEYFILFSISGFSEELLELAKIRKNLFLVGEY